jgi:hypothetical protein
MRPPESQAIQAFCFVGIVVNPVSIGHLMSLGSPQNGHVTPCGVPFALLNGPETVNVFLHFVQVMIFSICASARRTRELLTNRSKRDVQESSPEPRARLVNLV